MNQLWSQSDTVSFYCLHLFKVSSIKLLNLLTRVVLCVKMGINIKLMR